MTEGRAKGESSLWTPTTDEQWAGRARMAAARQAAGRHLDHDDREALKRAAEGPA